MTAQEIAAVIADYETAAKNAHQAGFDGVGMSDLRTRTQARAHAHKLAHTTYTHTRACPLTLAVASRTLSCPAHTTYTHARANGLESYGDMIIIHAYTRTHTLFFTNSRARTLMHTHHTNKNTSIFFPPITYFPRASWCVWLFAKSVLVRRQQSAQGQLWRFDPQQVRPSACFRVFVRVRVCMRTCVCRCICKCMRVCVKCVWCSRF